MDLGDLQITAFCFYAEFTQCPKSFNGVCYLTT